MTLERFDTAVVILTITQGNLYWCHSIGHMKSIVFFCKYVSIFYCFRDIITYLPKFKEVT